MSPFASPQLGHSNAQFVERKETFLISRQQALYAFLTTRKITPERLLPAFGGVNLARGPQPPIEFLLDETGLFEQSQDLFPDHSVQQILSNGMSVADRPSQSAPSVRPQASVIVDRASARSRGGAVKTVAALGAADQSLHDAGRDGASRRIFLVGVKTFLG